MIFTWIREGASEQGFNDRIRPLVQSNCQSCHGNADGVRQPILIEYSEIVKATQPGPPMSVAEQAFSLFAANEGFIDSVEVKKVVAYEAAMQSYLKSNHKDLLDSINANGDFNDDIAGQMRAALEKFKQTGTY